MGHGALTEQVGATMGARTALSTICHELASPLTALYTYLKLAERERGAPLEQIRACADRLSSIGAFARQLTEIAGAPVAFDLALAVESFASQLPGTSVGIEREGSTLAWIAASAAVAAVSAAMRVVAAGGEGSPMRVRIHGGATVRLRVDLGTEPLAWRSVEPWAARSPLDVWAASMIATDAGGAVRVGDIDGGIALELELPVPAPTEVAR